VYSKSVIETFSIWLGTAPYNPMDLWMAEWAFPVRMGSVRLAARLYNSAMVTLDM